MKVGDLVRFTSTSWSNFGLVINRLSECLVEVVWAGSEHIYMENVSNLEVVNEDR